MQTLLARRLQNYWRAASDSAAQVVVRTNVTHAAKEATVSRSNGNSGVIAMLLVIAILLIGGFIYHEVRERQEADVRIELPDVSIGTQDDRGSH